jgi:hypothetical protein
VRSKQDLGQFHSDRLAEWKMRSEHRDPTLAAAAVDEDVVGTGIKDRPRLVVRAGETVRGDLAALGLIGAGHKPAGVCAVAQIERMDRELRQMPADPRRSFARTGLGKQHADSIDSVMDMLNERICVFPEGSEGTSLLGDAGCWPSIRF